MLNVNKEEERRGRDMWYLLHILIWNSELQKKNLCCDFIFRNSKVQLSSHTLVFPQIVVLDEATDLCDEGLPDLMQGILRDCLNKSTVLVITDKLETLNMCDRVLVMEDGKVRLRSSGC